MQSFIQPSLDDSNNDLPEILDITEEDIQAFRDAWIDWVADERRHLPDVGGLLDQPARMMRTFFLYDSLAGKITRQLMKQKSEA